MWLKEQTASTTKRLLKLFAVKLENEIVADVFV